MNEENFSSFLELIPYYHHVAAIPKVNFQKAKDFIESIASSRRDVNINYVDDESGNTMLHVVVDHFRSPDRDNLIKYLLSKRSNLSALNDLDISCFHKILITQDGSYEFNLIMNHFIDNHLTQNQEDLDLKLHPIYSFLKHCVFSITEVTLETDRSFYGEAEVMITNDKVKKEMFDNLRKNCSTKHLISDQKKVIIDLFNLEKETNNELSMKLNELSFFQEKVDSFEKEIKGGPLSLFKTASNFLIKNLGSDSLKSKENIDKLVSKGEIPGYVGNMVKKKNKVAMIF